MIYSSQIIWSAWWKWQIHPLGQLFEFTLIDRILCLLFLPYSSLFTILHSRLTKSFHSPLQYLLDRMIYCCRIVLAVRKIQIRSLMYALIFPSNYFPTCISIPKQGKWSFITRTNPFSWSRYLRKNEPSST